MRSGGLRPFLLTYSVSIEIRIVIAGKLSNGIRHYKTKMES